MNRTIAQFRNFPRDNVYYYKCTKEKYIAIFTCKIETKQRVRTYFSANILFRYSLELIC